MTPFNIVNILKVFHFILLIGLFTSFKENPFHNLSHPSKRTQLTCYSYHPCYSNNVQISWLVQVYSKLENKYLNLSSGVESQNITLQRDHGVNVSTQCPKQECYSKLTVPGTIANGTIIWCGASTEDCVKDFSSTSSHTSIITPNVPSKYKFKCFLKHTIIFLYFILRLDGDDSEM